jgi:hypothetical protein
VGDKLEARLLRERAIEGDVQLTGAGEVRKDAQRSVTVNAAESPLGWLFARGLVSRRQYDAGERLRNDWERAQLSPRVTMAWDAAPVARGRSGAAVAPDLSGAQIDANRRFNAAVKSAGPGLADILWRIVCAGEGMREAETALGWPARRQARADFRAGPRRRLLPDSGLVLASLPVIGGGFRLSSCGSCTPSAHAAVAHRRVAHVVAGFVLAAVAAHDVLS